MMQAPDIDRLMAGPLGQFLHEQRGARDEAKAAARRKLRGAAVIVVPLLLAFLVLAPLEIDERFGFCLMAGMAVIYWSNGPVRAAKKRVKIGINEGIAASLGLAYSHEGEDSREFGLAKSYGMLPKYDRRTLEDFWTGPLDGRDFLLHEVHLEERCDASEEDRWKTVFRGAIIRIASDKRFHGTTLVQRSGRHKSFFGLGGRKDSISFDGHRLDIVQMVHPDFDDTFEVWSDDQVEARYLVHPLYVERLLAIESAFSGRDICSLFTGGDIVVAVRGEDMFEGGTMDPASDRAMVEKCARQFASMGQLAEVVNESRALGA